jgi:hypothetical protein
MTHQSPEFLLPVDDTECLPGPLNPERSAAVAFGEALQRYSSDDPAADAAELRHISEAAAGSAVYPELQRVYRLAGGILRWQMFDGGSELPPGLLWVQHDKGGVAPETDPRVLGYVDDYNYAVHALENLGLKNLFARRMESRQRHRDELIPLFAEVLGYTPTGRLLLSFAHAKPLSSNEQPLPEYSRLARERNIWEAQGPGAHRNPALRTALRKPIGRLLAETVDAPEHPNETPLERLRMELNERIRRYFIETLGLQPEEPLHISDRGCLDMHTNMGLHSGYEFAEALHTGDDPLQAHARKMLYAEYLLMEAIFAAPRTASCMQILEASARDALCGSGGALRILDMNEHDWGLDYTGFMREMQGQIVPSDAMPVRRIDPLHTKIPHRVTPISTEGELQVARQQIVGEAQNMRAPDAYGYRLILHQKPKYNEIEGPDGDLAISLNRRAEFAPFVPGYEVVSVRRQADEWRYGLRYIGEDPYVPCRITIPPAGVERLAGVLSGFNLHDLADAITSYPDITVADLTTLLQSSFQPLMDSMERNFRRNVDLAGVLRQCVRKGEIHVRCQQSASIVRESLHTAFGYPCAQTLFGSVLSMQGGPIDRVEHEQVAAHLGGRLYMLDASPGLPPVTTAPGAEAPVVTNVPPPQPEAIAAGVALAAALRKQERDTRAASAERVLYEQLRVLLHAPTNEVVHARLQSNRRRDVAAVALGCLLDLHVRDTASSAPTLALLQAAAETRGKRDTFGVHRYPRFILDSMRYAVEAARDDVR